MASPELDLRVHAALDLLANDEPGVGVAVSGGSDSTALLLLAHDWARARGAKLHAATVDHGLRTEAAAEAERVAALCASLGVPHRTLVWRPSGSVAQADARNARHRLLAEWARADGIATIALGHTRDDRIETFLIRARAGSGWWGLAGPMPASPSPAWPEGDGVRLIRPLLASCRDQLRDRLRRSNTGWIDDPSNDLLKHERIRMRRLASRLVPEASARLIAIMDRLATLRAAVLADARSALPEISFRPDAACIPPDVLERLSGEGRFRLVEALVLAAGGSPHRPPPDALRTALRTALCSPQGGNLAGAWLRPAKAGLQVAPEPPRRGRTPASPAWERAKAILGDPGARMLAF